MNNIKLETRTIPAGTIVKFNGIPLELVSNTEVRTHPNNFDWICDEKNVPKPWFVRIFPRAWQ